MTTDRTTQHTAMLERVRWRLALLWYIVAVVVFLLLVVQSFTGLYGDRVKEAWNWALPALLPTISLITSVLGSGALLGEEKGKKAIAVKRGYARLAFWLSSAYLFLLLLTLLAQPVVVLLNPSWGFGPVEALNLSHLWLAPFQGVVVSALAVLFFKKQAEADSSAAKVQACQEP